MSEYTTKGRTGLDELEAVGRRLIVDGYLRGDSVLTPGQPVWSLPNFVELKEIYIDRPDQSPDKYFFEKLAVQFTGASDGAIQLFAELLLTNVLPLSNYLGKTKVSHVRQVLAMMEHPVSVPDDVVSATAVGAFNGGTAFGVRRWSQLWLLIYFGLHLHSLSAAERGILAKDPLAFRDALAAVPAPNEPVQRAAVRYLAFPKFFRPIVNAGHRRLIRDTFASYLTRSVSDDVDVDLDEINRAFEAEQNGPINFYQEPWKSMWKPVKTPKKIVATDDGDDIDDTDDELLVPATEFSIVDPDQELADSLHVDLDWLARCADLLRDRPQLIFYGPPGTGKTYIAKALARHLAGLDNVTIVQFHPAYSYEDFFEGFRPTSHGNGQVGFELKPGPMRRLTDRARKHPDQLFVLLVDEINRGNLAKIFGELYFLLEYRDEAIDLMYSSDDAEPFTLPRNVLVIFRVEHGRPLDRIGGHRHAPTVRIRPVAPGTGTDEIDPATLAHRPQVPAARRRPAPRAERGDRRSGLPGRAFVLHAPCRPQRRRTGAGVGHRDHSLARGIPLRGPHRRPRRQIWPHRPGEEPDHR